MRSMPGAIVWEMLYRGRWLLPAAAIGACLFPMLIENALKMQGGIDREDPAQIMMHLVLVQLNMFMFGVGVMTVQGSLSRLYTAPIPTSTLVSWHLFPAMLLVGLQTAGSIAVLNAMFSLNWPIWGPALFGAVGIAAILASIWQAEKSPAWIPVFMAAAGIVLGLWYKTRHGSLFARIEHQHYWNTVTTSDFLTMLVFAVVSYYAAVQGVARSRRGDTLRSLGIIAWFERVLDPPPEPGPPFLSPAAAQFWFVWRQKGWFMPISVVFAMTVGVLIWLIAIRDPQELVMGFVMGGLLLTFVGLIGAISIGNTGPSDQCFEMGNFLGTRPMTSREMSRLLLNVTLRSVVYAWSIWAAAFVCVAVMLLLFGVTPPPQLRLDAIWWYVPATLLGPWIVASLGVSLGLTGRSWILLLIFCVLFPAALLYITLTGVFLSPESQVILNRMIWGTIGVLFTLSTVWVYLAARARALIDSSAMYRAALIWVVASVLVVCLIRLYDAVPVSAHLLMIGLLALAVAPFPTVPLAVAWNRVR